MKFGRRLESGLWEKGWEDKYIRYDALKVLVHAISTTGDVEEQMQLVQQFKDVITEDVARVDAFFQHTLTSFEVLWGNCPRIPGNHRERRTQANAEPQAAATREREDSATRDAQAPQDPSGGPAQLHHSRLRRRQRGPRLASTHSSPHAGQQHRQAPTTSADRLEDTDEAVPRDGSPERGEEHPDDMPTPPPLPEDSTLRAHLHNILKATDYSSTDPQVVGNQAAEQYLHAFVALSEQTEALRRYTVVNHAALTKIVKKYRRRVLDSTTLASEVVNAATLPNLRLACLEPDQRRRLARLQRDLQALGDELLIASSTFNEYVCSLRTQYWAQVAEHKARVRETHLFHEKPRAKRLAMLTDFRQTFSPAIMLILQTIVAVGTLVSTYTISCNIIVDEATNQTVFDQKGYFISASIDKSPASHIGTLGLSISCFLLAASILVRHKLMKRLLVGRATLLHRFSLFLALISLFSGTGVAAYQHHLHSLGHNTFAVLFFILAMIHVGIDNHLERKYKLYTPEARTMRLVLVLLVALCVVVFLTFLRMSGDMGSHRDPTLLFIAAVAELAAFGFLLCYFLTLLPNFNKTRLYVVLVERRATSIMAPFQVDAFLTTDKRITASSHRLLRRTSRRFARAGFDVLSADADGIIPRIRRLLTSQPWQRQQGRVRPHGKADGQGDEET